MKIVIDIPEEAYNLLNNEGVDWLGAEHILDAVAKGKPLSKGHGRLIDADELKKIWHGCKFVGSIDCLVDCRPTIIEAESEEEE